MACADFTEPRKRQSGCFCLPSFSVLGMESLPDVGDLFQIPDWRGTEESSRTLPERGALGQDGLKLGSGLHDFKDLADFEQTASPLWVGSLICHSVLLGRSR